uniref:Uncharacterized protein n=1 Tax=Anguilla anguilla TaxID=7936 RepID=A0A0E9W7A0_ANGAN
MQKSWFLLKQHQVAIWTLMSFQCFKAENRKQKHNRNNRKMKACHCHIWPSL